MLLIFVIFPLSAAINRLQLQALRQYGAQELAGSPSYVLCGVILLTYALTFASVLTLPAARQSAGSRVRHLQYLGL